MTPCASVTKARKGPLPDPADRQLYTEQHEVSGEILRVRNVGSFTLIESLHSKGLSPHEHSHPHAYVTFVIEGALRERYVYGESIYRSGAVRYLPAGEVHSDEIDSSLRCLHVRVDPAVIEGLGRKLRVPSKPAEIKGFAATWLANRLYAEFASNDDASRMAAEGLILEILAELARSDVKPGPTAVPAWLKQATDIVESRFLERLSLTDIASEVGVHYVHLSRQFHKYNRCTVGELIRRRRVQHASHLLAHSKTPLAEVALICGFSDQSHLSFLFKRYMGVSPSKFRLLAGMDGSAHPPDACRSGFTARNSALAYHASASGK